MIEKSDRSVPRSTLEQWAVLRAVVDTGSFAGAAHALHRSQSTISYAVARLRDAVGIELLSLEGRRAVLTDDGAILLAEVTPLIENLNRIENRVARTAQGGRLLIRLLVDTLFPRTRLLDVIETFAALQPNVAIDVRQTVRQSISDPDLPEHDLAILIAIPGSCEADIIARVDLVAVALHSHPLARCHETSLSLTPATLALHERVEIHGHDGLHGLSNLEGRIWRMNTVEAAIDAVRRGLCFGWLPKHLIYEDLAQGNLVRLQLGQNSQRTYPLALTSPIPRTDHDQVLTDFTKLLFKS